MEDCHLQEPDQSRQWPLDPCPGCGAMEVEDCDAIHPQQLADEGLLSDPALDAEHEIERAEQEAEWEWEERERLADVGENRCPPRE